MASTPSPGFIIPTVLINSNGEDTFDADNTLPDSNLKPHVAGQLTRRLILEYFSVTGFDKHFVPWAIPQDVESGVTAELACRDLQIDSDVVNKHVRTGLEIATKAYRHVSTDLQIDIALYTTSVTLIDDANTEQEAMAQLAQRYYSGLPQLHPVHQLCADMITRMQKHFTGHCANIIVFSCLAYPGAEVLESKVKKMKLIPASYAFVDDLRLKAGIAEAYAAYIWPKDMFPDEAEYIQALSHAAKHLNYVNDLFSFYKEELVNDTTNYVHNYARVHGQTIVQSMRSLLQQILQLGYCIKQILGDGKAYDAWFSFAAGYAQYLFCPRYRLEEILPEYFLS